MIHLESLKKGAFTKYCKNKGYDKVTCSCILEGLKSNNELTRKRAMFAYQFGFRTHGKTCAKVEQYLKSKKD